MALFEMVAKLADGREEKSDVVILEASRDPVDLELNRHVVDRVWIDEDGFERREWAGTPEQIAACARVNPVSAALFAAANRVGRKDAQGRMEFTWERKADRADMALRAKALL